MDGGTGRIDQSGVRIPILDITPTDSTIIGSGVALPT